MEKIKVYKLEINGSYLISHNLDDIMETLKLEIEEGVKVGENIQSEIYVLEMNEDDYNNLPEFDGF